MASTNLRGMRLGSGRESNQMLIYPCVVLPLSMQAAAHKRLQNGATQLALPLPTPTSASATSSCPPAGR